MFKDIKENMFIINDKRGIVSRDKETSKKNQMEILELKNTMLEVKNVVGGLNSRREVTEKSANSR